MALQHKRTLFIFFLIFIVEMGIIGSAQKTEKIPKKESALEQYFYARDNFYEPATRATGEERLRLYRLNILALQMVIDEFHNPQSITTRTLAQYEQGRCYLELGEKRKAREAFNKCLKYPLPEGEPKDTADTLLITLHFLAQEELKLLNKQSGVAK